MADTSNNFVAYLDGQANTVESKYAFLRGGNTGTNTKPSFLAGNILSLDSISGFVSGGGGEITDSIYVYLSGGIGPSDNISAYAEGTGTGDPIMAEYDYVWLKSSDNSIQKKFRVLAQGYDDGTLEKAENLQRTIGGGIDHSMGAIYKSWNPIIRVRASEPLTDYGSLADLISLYNLNDPGGTPSNLITFIDHHGDTYTVRMVGSLQKGLMGVKVEGENAWSIVKISLLEVPA